MTQHNQYLSDEQEDYVRDIQKAFKKKRGTRISKDKTIQMIIDYCRSKNIDVDKFIR